MAKWTVLCDLNCVFLITADGEPKPVETFIGSEDAAYDHAKKISKLQGKQFHVQSVPVHIHESAMWDKDGSTFTPRRQNGES